jgi:iron complex transport system ATP-binding protein
MDDLAIALADVSTVGGYFHLDTGPGGPSWQPLARFFTGHDEFTARIAAAADLLKTREMRIAASILHLGIAVRLWSPLLGAAVLHHTLPDWDSRTLHYKPVPSGPLPLRLPAPSARPITGPHPADAIFTSIEPLLRDLGALVHATVKIAPRLLWGNAASALGGTVRAIARARPDHAADALALGAQLLQLGDLRRTGHFTESAPGQPFFTRTTCCLYYRIPNGGKCGDCALLTSEVRHAQWVRAIQEEPS